MQIQKIGIVDDHILFAEGISNMISENSQYEICFVATTATQLFNLLATTELDILILDVNLAGENGIEILKKLKNSHPALKILLLTMYLPEDLGLKKEQLLSDAYVLKFSGRKILDDALMALLNNEKFMDPGIPTQSSLGDNFTKQLKLTRREREIIDLIAKGKTSKEIAAQLFLSELTIKTHRKNISEKLGTKGIADLVLINRNLL